MPEQTEKIAIASDEEIAQYAGVRPASGEPRGGAPAESAGGSAEHRIAALEKDLAECKDKLLRAQAECANIAKRLHQEHAEALRLAGLDLARSMLPVVDNLERMMANMTGRPEDDPLVSGVRLIADQLAKALGDHGIEPIPTAGQAFDPLRHEAMMQDRESDLPAGTITKELQRGYMMHDRVLRPARVVISAGVGEATDDSDGGNHESTASAG